MSATNDTLSPEPTDPAPSPADSPGAPAPWISALILVGFIVALVLIFLVMRHTRLAGAEPDPEAAERSAYQASIERHAIDTLQALLPAVKYKQLKAAGPKCGKVKLGTAAKPAESADEAGLPTVCVICLDTFQPKNVVRRLGCGHVFHASCIDKWFLKQHYTCPLCVASYMPPLPTEPRPSLVSSRSYHP